MGRFAQGKYSLKNPEKYIGTKTPTYRSSWDDCQEQLIDESTFTDYNDGSVTYSRTVIECD